MTITITTTTTTPRSLLAFGFTLASLLAMSDRALAADAGVDTSTGSGSNDVRALEKQLNDETSALSTADCNAACRALGSIRRAADRICALEPGPRCDAARTKANDATRRVREACPDCSLAVSPTPPAPRDDAVSTPTKAGAATDAPKNAPPADREGGGCRSCATGANGGTSKSPIDLGLLGLAILGISRVIRRRRNS